MSDNQSTNTVDVLLRVLGAAQVDELAESAGEARAEFTDLAASRSGT